MGKLIYFPSSHCRFLVSDAPRWAISMSLSGMICGTSWWPVGSPLLHSCFLISISHILFPCSWYCNDCTPTAMHSPQSCDLNEKYQTTHDRLCRLTWILVALTDVQLELGQQDSGNVCPGGSMAVLLNNQSSTPTTPQQENWMGVGGRQRARYYHRPLDINNCAVTLNV